jgi:hypothetical protein
MSANSKILVFGRLSTPKGAADYLFVLRPGEETEISWNIGKDIAACEIG